MFLLGKKFYIIFISLWIFGLYFILKPYNTPTKSDKLVEDRIEYLQSEVDSLRQKLAKLQAVYQISDHDGGIQCRDLYLQLKRAKRQLSLRSGGGDSSLHRPSSEYEQTRRKIETHVRELSYFTGNQLNKVSKKLSHDEQKKWTHVTSRFADQIRVLLATIRNLTEVDGYQSWREYEHESLSKLMQARLNALQNPKKPCEEVKRVTCNLNKGCGYGCEIHHAMHCFHIAYALGRPMILFSNGWNYNPGGFDEIFQSPSPNCSKSAVASGASWSRFETAEVVNIPLIDLIAPRTAFMPMSIPQDLSDRLIRLHGNPFVWFTGQLLKYLLRPQEWLTEFLETKFETMKYETPIVGVHVRRTDKLTAEAALHDISEYMKHVEDYYSIYQYQNPTSNFTKRVYLATDEPTVFKDARTKYPDYVFYGDTAVAKSAQVDSRYGTDSLKGVLMDIHFLSLSDYLVCTFSSQVCRVAYEVMQQRVTDGAWRVQSLDDIYYFGGQNAHNQRAIISHKAFLPDEFSFKRGDIIGTEGNHWDGSSKGKDKTTGRAGLYPTYKVEEIVNISKMHTYPEVTVKIEEHQFL